MSSISGARNQLTGRGPAERREEMYDGEPMRRETRVAST